MIDYSFTYDDFKDKIDILRKNDFWFETDETYNMTYVKYKSFSPLIFNKNILSQIIDLFENGFTEQKSRR